MLSRKPRKVCHMCPEGAWVCKHLLYVFRVGGGWINFCHMCLQDEWVYQHLQCVSSGQVGGSTSIVYVRMMNGFVNTCHSDF